MPENSAPALQLVLKQNDGLGRIAVDMQAFFELSFDLAEDLQDMVDRWQHLTAHRRRTDLLTAHRAA